MLRDKLVLVVDDNDLFLRSVVRALNGTGARVLTATNGAAAVVEAGRTKPDLIIMDVQMPELNGLDAAAQILAARPVPVLLLSGDDMQAKAQALGCAFLDKAKLAGLVNILGELMKSAEERRPIEKTSAEVPRRV